MGNLFITKWNKYSILTTDNCNLYRYMQNINMAPYTKSIQNRSEALTLDQIP